ncbi:uncharacterized protein FIBRA_01338 [Fibroporia radiculosa]|uniref:F-box domain-containing protein n=1 Tax=Fibroporia radiculosa TaxID=599839 RepID=J4HT59_9APHY|nr:uncharacterized protein FIBRA_01338 [Fibroporia radiculosa]CCL99322.1 predicted protein [Fibroporia radiculosa]
MDAPHRGFAPELCDQIIDYLWDDRSALAACALTCRAWLPRARFHTFCCVKVGGPVEFMRFSRLLDASPSVASFVRRIVVVSRTKLDWWPKSTPTRVDREWPLLVRNLPKVEDLELVKLSIDALSNEAVKLLPGLLSIVRILRLESCTGWTRVDLPRFLSSALRMNELHLLDVSWQPSIHFDYRTPNGAISPKSATGSSMPAEGARIEALKVTLYDRKVGAWILTGPFTLQISQLFVGLSPGEERIPRELQMFLLRAGETLRHLVLSYGSHTRPFDMSESVPTVAASTESLSIAHNPRLESLHFAFVEPGCTYTHLLGFLRGAADTIRGIPVDAHRALCRLRISVWAHLVLAPAVPDPEHCGGWTHIDRALEAFIRNRPDARVTISILNPDAFSIGFRNGGEMFNSLEDVVKRLLQRLPKFQAQDRGYLTLVLGDRWGRDGQFGGGIVDKTYERSWRLPITAGVTSHSDTVHRELVLV